jgi:hypothetical protein
MRRLWGLASVLGLFVMVAFGTWGCLTSSAEDPSASTSLLIAAGGAAVMVIGLAARGDDPKVVAKGRRILGGVGLVVAPVAGALGLLELGTSPSTALAFLFVAIGALALWAQAIALQVGLSFRVAAAWLAAALVFAVIAVLIAAGIAAVVGAAVRAMGWDSLAGSPIGSAVAVACIGAILRAWATDRPDRQAVPAAVGAAVFGRATPGGIEVLAAGPGPILRGLPRAAEPTQTRNATLFALDSRLARARDDSPDETKAPLASDD